MIADTQRRRNESSWKVVRAGVLGLAACLAWCAAPAATNAGECDILVETYGSTFDEVANCVVQTYDGGFVATGYLSSTGGKTFLLVKFDSQGNFLWRRAYGGSGDEEGLSVIETHDHYLIVVGYTTSYSAGRADFLMGKFDANGNRIWMRTWGDTGDEKAYGVIETSSSHELWLAGYSTSFNTYGDSEVVAAKIAADGSTLTGGHAGYSSLILSRQYEGYALAEVYNTGGICVAGRFYAPATGNDILLIKFNFAGELAWAKRFRNDDSTDSTEYATTLVRTSDACLALAGPATYFDSVYPDTKGGWLLKTDADAQFVWGRFVGGLGPYYDATLTDLVETEDAELVVAGAYTGQLTPGFEDQAIVAKFDFSGGLIWNRAHEIGTDCKWNSVARGSYGNLLLAGLTYGYGSGGNDMLLARYDSEGLTCLPDVGGPAFGSWSPSEERLYPSDGQFSFPTLDWAHTVSPPTMTVADICPRMYTVCPDGTADFQYIQDAIDAAPPYSVIELCDATFTGEGNTNLNFNGKPLTIRSQSGNPETCVIDCYSPTPLIVSRGFYFGSQEGPCSVVEGLTIKNGFLNMLPGAGGAIYCGEGSSPTIQDCKILDCDAQAGSAVYGYYSSPNISGCTIAGCGWSGGAALEFDHGSPTVSGCQVTGNAAGGMLFQFVGSTAVSSCTVSGNGPGTVAGGLAFYVCAGPVNVSNSIVWGNCGAEIWYGGIEPPPPAPIVHCCNVEGGWPGTNNINADPLFVCPQSCENAPTTEGDYHLCPLSPCAPAQQPTCGLIGALGVPPICPADSNCDGYVNWRDIDFFVAAMSGCDAWGDMFLLGKPTCSYLDNDVNGDCTVNWRDIDPFVARIGAICP